MAKLEAFESQEAIPEALREFYIERDGKWVPDVPTQQNALDRERRQRAEAVKKAEEAARTLQEMQAKLEKLEAAQTAEPADQSRESERKIRAFEAEIKAIQAKLAAADEKANALERDRAESRITEVLRQAAIAEGVSPAAADDLVALPHFRKGWRLTETGDPALFDGDSPRYNDATGKLVSPGEHTHNYVKERPHFLPPSNGGGASGSAGSRPSGRFSATRQELKDVPRYSQLKADMEKAGLDITKDLHIIDT